MDLETIRAAKLANTALKLKSSRKPKKAAAPATKKRPPPIAGIDGKTVPQRIREAMLYHAGATRVREYKQADLVRDVNDLYGHDILSQQTLSALMNGSSYSQFIPLIAEACGVRSVWLAYGLDPMIEGKH